LRYKRGSDCARAKGINRAGSLVVREDQLLLLIALNRLLLDVVIVRGDRGEEKNQKADGAD